MADTNNEVGRTQIDPRGKTSRVIHSRDVTWIGKTWANSYKIKKIQRASGYVDTDEDFQLEEEDQDIDVDELEPEDDSEPIQVGQPQAEEPREPSDEVEDDEPVASRTISQTVPVEPVAARTRQSLGSDPEVSAFVDVKEDKTLNEWLQEKGFVTSTMSDPDQPKNSKKLGGILI